MTDAALSFPAHHPPTYPAHHEVRHEWSLDLSSQGLPRPLRTFADLGYPSDFRQQGSDLAVSEPFRVLHDDDAHALDNIIRDLEQYKIVDGAETRRSIIRGGAYRSFNIRSLFSHPDLLDYVSRAVGYNVGHSSLPHQMAHINIMDEDSANDSHVPTGNWHIDQNPIVLVLSVAGMDGTDGGAFQIFDGTRSDSIELLGQGRPLPASRCVNVPLPSPGYGVLLHGAFVMHRSAPMRPGRRRVSVVSAFEPLSPSAKDMNPNAFVADSYGDDVNGVAERSTRAFEYARHKAWRMRKRLDAFTEADLWTADADELIVELTRCMQEGLECATAMKRGEVAPGQALVEYLRVTDYEKADTEDG